MDSSGKKKLYEYIISRLDPSAGRIYSILDFGCGVGDFLGLLSEKVGSGSQLWGIDSARSSINVAIEKHRIINFLCSKFDGKTGFPDASFDIVVTIDAFECVRDKNALINEFHRILKPGGKVLAAHWDWDTMLYNAESRKIAERAVAAFSGWQQPWMAACDGQMGRKLWGLFEGSGKFRGRPDSFNLIETTYLAGNYGFARMQDISKLPDDVGIEKAEHKMLEADLIEKDQKKQYFFSLTSFLYIGEKL